MELATHLAESPTPKSFKQLTEKTVNPTINKKNKKNGTQRSYFKVVSTEVYPPYKGKDSGGSHFWVDVSCSAYFGPAVVAVAVLLLAVDHKY